MTPGKLINPLSTMRRFGYRSCLNFIRLKQIRRRASGAPAESKFWIRAIVRQLAPGAWAGLTVMRITLGTFGVLAAVFNGVP